MFRSSYWFSLILLFGLASLALAGVPQTMNLQGFLTDDSGTPLADGSHWIEFRIFDHSVGGFQVWSSGGSVEIAVSGGLFAYQLGTVVPLPYTVRDYDSL